MSDKDLDQHEDANQDGESLEDRFNLDRSEQEDVSKHQEESIRTTDDVARDKSRQQLINGNDDDLQVDEESPAEETMEADSDDTGSERSIYLTAYEDAVSGEHSEEEAREHAAAATFTHYSSELEQDEAAIKTVKEAFNAFIAMDYEQADACTVAAEAGSEIAEMNSLDEEAAYSFAAKGVFEAITDAGGNAKEARNAAMTTLIAAAEIFGEEGRNAQKMAKKQIKAIQFAAPKKAEEPKSKKEEKPKKKAKVTVSREKKKPEGSGKSVLKWGLVATLAIGTFGGGYVGYDHFQKLEQENRLFQVAMSQVEVQLQDIYSDGEMSDSQKATRAALSISKLSNVSDNDAVRLAVRYGQARNMDEAATKELAQRVQVMRTLLGSGKPDGEILGQFAATEAAAKADSINLTGSERALFVIRSLTGMSEVSEDDFKELVKTHPSLKDMDGFETAKAIIEISHDMSDTDLRKAGVIKMATGMYATSALEEAKAQNMTENASIQKTIYRTNEFLANQGLGDAFNKEVIPALEKAGISKKQLDSQVAISRIIKKANASGESGDAYIKVVKNETTKHADKRNMPLFDAAVLVSDAVKNAGIYQAMSEESATARAIHEGVDTFIERNPTAKQMKAVAHNVIDGAAMSNAKQGAFKRGMDTYYEALAADAKPEVAVSDALLEVFKPSIQNPAVSQGASVAVADAIVEVMEHESPLAKTVAAAQLSSIKTSLDDGKSAEESVQDLVMVTAKATAEEGQEEMDFVLHVAGKASKTFETNTNEQEKISAKTSALYLAKKANLSDVEVQMATKYAEQKVIAKQAGLNSSEQSAVADRAASKIAKNAGKEYTQAKRSLSRVHRSIDVAQTPEQRAGDVARIEAEKAGKSLVEQEVEAQMAMLDYRAEESNAPATVASIARVLVGASMKAEALGMSPEEAAKLIRESELKASKKLGIDSDQYKMLRDRVIELAKVETKIKEEAQAPEATEVVAGNMNEVQQQVLKLDIKLGEIESRLSQMEEMKTDIQSLYTQIDMVSGAHDDFKERIQVVMEDVYGGYAGSYEEYKQQLAKLEKNMGRLKKNYGWLHNRQCESEARDGTFHNEGTCDAVYSRVSKDYRLAKEAKAPKSDKERRIAATAKNVVTEAVVAAELPKTIKSKQRVASAGKNVCAGSSNSWVYNGIWQNGASLTRFDGRSEEVTYGTNIPELGDVLFFQVNKQPKFVQFTNGIVCKG